MPNTQRTPKGVKSTTGTVTADKAYDEFTEEERGAMKERAKELKASSRRGSRAAKADGDSEVRAKIAEMPEADRAIAERIHDIVRTSAPDLAPKLWYGMPAYARDGKVVCFFQSAQKFKTRYATLGFSDLARLDDGTMWPSAYALTELNADDEARIGALIERAVS
ncbi:iron chaperone [Streptomyces sp. NPDC058385]|uniref:iron chaperone n=1 Tax=Streptomyces sp. NPDC058385 TaxID=3346473 RepID=UPI00364C35F1